MRQGMPRGEVGGGLPIGTVRVAEVYGRMVRAGIALQWRCLSRMMKYRLLGRYWGNPIPGGASAEAEDRRLEEVFRRLTLASTRATVGVAG